MIAFVTTRMAAAVLLVLLAPAAHAQDVATPATPIAPATPAAPAAPAAPAMDYATAKAAADTDEASLDVDAQAALRTAQSTFIDAATATCATNEARPDLSRFAVVMALDASGRVTRTWREGGSPLSACIERQASTATLAPPPRQPLHTVIEISFTP